MSDSMRPHRRQPTRLLCPWDSPSKNTGVGCHFLLHGSSNQTLKHNEQTIIIICPCSFAQNSKYRRQRRGGVARGGGTARRRSVGAGYPWRSDAAGSCSCNGNAFWRGPRRLAALAQLSRAPGLPRGAQGSGDSPGVGWRGGGLPGAPPGLAPHSPASLSLSFH